MSKDIKSQDVTPPPYGGWGITTDDGKWVSNFHIEILDVIGVRCTTDLKPVVSVRLRLSFADDKYSAELLVPVSELDNIKWTELDFRCKFNPDVAPARVKRLLSHNIREKLPEVLEKNQYRLKRLGVHIIEGEAVYCAGSEVIRPSHSNTDEDRLGIESVPMPYSLDIDPTLAEKEAVVDTIELLSLFPNVGRLLLAYTLMCFMWELYKTAWMPPRFCLYIHGITRSLKTTLTAFFSQVYNRSNGIDNPPRLEGSIPKAVELMREKAHCAIVMNDLFPADSDTLRRKQEANLIEITRIIGDGVPPGRYGKSMDPPTIGVTFTAEYLIGTGSSAARLLPIEVTRPSNETLRRFSDFQEKPLMLSTLYYNFIRWFITNYDWAQKYLKDCWSAYKNSDDLEGRLRETHYYLNSAYSMFLEYCCDQGCITEAQVKDMQQSFLMLITDLVRDQQVRVDKCNLNNVLKQKIDYLNFIRKLYRGGAFKLASSAKEFDAAKHDGVEHYGRLYLYGERFKKIIESANFNLNDVIDDLKAQGALYYDKGANTTQLFVSPGEKRRCYAIILAYLK